MNFYVEGTVNSSQYPPTVIEFEVNDTNNGPSRAWGIFRDGTLKNFRSANEDTGSNSLGMNNAPDETVNGSNPYTWIYIRTSDGTICCFPVWKLWFS
jgi:hypothetical protein